MDRRREIAASPIRTAHEAWTTITELITGTLERSPDIDGQRVRQTLDALTPAALALVAPGYLERQPLTLIAEPLCLTINTVSGDAAFRVFEDENLNPVPGAATAIDWTLHVPRPEGLATLIDNTVVGLTNVSTEQASKTAKAEAGRSSMPTIDLQRLKLKS